MTPKSKFDGIIRFFREVLQTLPDKRTGKNTRYGMEDAALSALGVFFTQSPSFLSYQRTMTDTKGRSNGQSLFGVHQIPCDNQIRDLLDGVEPRCVFPVFEEILLLLDEAGRLSEMRAFDDTLLVAVTSHSVKPCCANRSTSFWSAVLTSHQTLYEHLDGIALPTVVGKRWTGKTEEIYTYRYLNSRSPARRPGCTAG